MAGMSTNFHDAFRNLPQPTDEELDQLPPLPDGGIQEVEFTVRPATTQEVEDILIEGLVSEQ